MHPRNPHCPTMHFNYRYFETAVSNAAAAAAAAAAPLRMHLVATWKSHTIQVEHSHASGKTPQTCIDRQLLPDCGE
jgi:coproporphyrinogen III oxidase